MTELPTQSAEMLAYLERAADHGDMLSSLLIVGAQAEPVRSYVAANPDLIAEPTSRGLVIRFGELVRWDVSLDHDDRIAGYGATGYRTLMEALGIDFSGKPYVAGDG